MNHSLYRKSCYHFEWINQNEFNKQTEHANTYE